MKTLTSAGAYSSVQTYEKTDPFSPLAIEDPVQQLLDRIVRIESQANLEMSTVSLAGGHKTIFGVAEHGGGEPIIVPDMTWTIPDATMVWLHVRAVEQTGASTGGAQETMALWYRSGATVDEIDHDTNESIGTMNGGCSVVASGNDLQFVVDGTGRWFVIAEIDWITRL